MGIIREHDRRAKQRVRINVRIIAHHTAPENDDVTDSYVSYSPFAEEIRKFSHRRHINVAEILAKEIANLCIKDSRVQKAFVEVEKIDIYNDVAGVGVLVTQTKEDGP